MSSAEETGDDRDECRVAVNAVMDVALEHCGSQQEVRRQLASMLGAEPDTDCGAALGEGLNQETCESFRGIRQWVMCRAHEMISDEGLRFGDAVESSWQEAKQACLSRGVEV